MIESNAQMGSSEKELEKEALLGEKKKEVFLFILKKKENRVIVKNRGL